MGNHFKNVFVSVALVGSLIGTPTAILTSNAKYQNLALFAPQNELSAQRLVGGILDKVAPQGQFWGIGRVQEAFSGYVKAPISPETETLLKRLAICESGNDPSALNPTDGGSPSYGLFQFKKGTWTGYIRYYGMFPDVEDEELMNLIYDREIQEDLAGRMLEDKLFSHWKNCMTRFGVL